jgi:hypothetical protein
MSTTEDVPKDDAPSAEEIEQYSNYVKAADGCLRSGPQSPDCDKARILEAAAVAYGADPSLVDSLHACFQNPDTEECAKALAKVAAIAACTAVTEGAGGILCTYAAPIVVDIVWPTVSPIIMPVWHWANDLTDYTNDMTSQLLEAFGLGAVAEVFFGGDEGPTFNEQITAIKVSTANQLRNAYTQSLEAVATARNESQKALHSSLTRKDIGITRKDLSLKPTPDDQPDAVGWVSMDPDVVGWVSMDGVQSELEHWLALEPAWVDELNITQPESSGTVRFRKRPENVGVSFDNGSWTPASMDVIGPLGFDMINIPYCTIVGMQRRAEGLKRATAKAIGSTIKKQTMLADTAKLRSLAYRKSESDSSSTLLLVAAAAAAIGGGIWLWKKH